MQDLPYESDLVAAVPELKGDSVIRRYPFTLVIITYQRLFPVPIHVNFVVSFFVQGVVRYHEWSYVQKGSSRGLWF